MADASAMSGASETRFNSRVRTAYLRVLGWAFAIFSTARVLAYLPTIAALWEHRDSSNYSLLTWATWTGANLTMAAWLFEHGSPGARGAVWVHLANSALCAAIASLILALR
jgi:hypothetical protein